MVRATPPFPRARVSALRLLVAFVTTVLVVLGLVSAAHAQLLSPGPLSKAHGSVEGDQKCNECHSSGKRVDANLCLKCHNDLGARLNAGQGLHGRNYKGKPCEGCHVEHQGNAARLVRWPGGDQTKLDHALTGWALQNAHQKAACNKCHNKTNSRGAATFLGLNTACASCHKDPHENRFGATCTNCHDDVSFKNLKLTGFNHDLARFPLRGAHQKVACANSKCHSEPPKYVGLQFSTCTSCHTDPHRGKLGATCQGCHDENKWRPAQFKANAHPGVSLGGGHSSVACKSCHDKGNLAAPSRGTECASCHKAVHKAPFGRGCASCHGSITWMGLPRAVGLAAHPRTAFPLTGKHGETACSGCHKASLPREVRYRELSFSRCNACHEDQHKGEFAKNANAQNGECKGCHETSGFRPTLFGVGAHSQTKFPLTGKHAAVACSACHSTSHPRLDLHVAKQACADCHQNPHGEQFAKEMKDGGCAHCHEPGGWNLPKIDHSTWPLTGAHASARCERCHKPSAEDKKSGRGASYRGVPRNCAGCHDDAHAGQFRAAAVKGASAANTAANRECDACHVTTVFKIARFDHTTLAYYPLTGSHEKQPCAKCHPNATLKDGTEVVRWRLPQSDCKYCHADPHARAAARGAR